jgi:hypothetical protein
VNVPGQAVSVPSAGAGKPLPLGSQTPFSVFFSGPGPAGSGAGTEAAAGTLPKMLVPAANSAARNNQANGADALNPNPPASGTPSGPHNAAPLMSKDSPAAAPAATSSASSPGATSEDPAVGPALHRDPDLNAASVQAAAAQNAAAATSVAPNPAAALPLAGSASPVANSLPAPDTLPAAAPAAPSAVPPAVEAPLAAAPGPVQMAQMVSRVEQSEMRIGMNTSAFGSVEVRAVVHANDVGLVVGSEKGDLRSLLSTDIPAISNTLQEQNLRLHSVNFMQGFAFSNNASGGGESQPRPFVPPKASPAGFTDSAVDNSTEAAPPGAYAGTGGGLSILA